MTTKHPPDEPVRNLTPTFAQPPTPPAEEPEGTEERVLAGLRNLPTEEGRPRRFLGLPRRDPGAALLESPAPSPTATSVTTGDARPTPEGTTALVVAAVLVATTAAAFGVRWLLRAQLRQPNKTQARAIGAPIAKILLRHFEQLTINDDLADGLTAAAAVGGYLNAGPLLLPLSTVVNPGVPADINEEE